MITSVLVFAACGIALLVATLWLRRQDPDTTVREMFERLLADRAVRIAVLVIWWWLGWHFLGGQTTEAPIR